MDEVVLMYAAMTVYPAARLSRLWPVLSPAEHRRAWRLGTVVVAAITGCMGMATGVDAGLTDGWSDAGRGAWAAGILALMLTTLVAWARLVSMGQGPILGGNAPGSTERVPTAWSRACNGARWVLEHSVGGVIALQVAWILRGESLLPAIAVVMIGFLGILGGLGGLAYHWAEGLRRSGRRMLAMVSTGLVFALLALLFLGVAWVTPTGLILPR